MTYLTTAEQQYNYSKKKLPELQERYNEELLRHQRKCEKLSAKMKRHEAILSEYKEEEK
jgi:hypothetical protein